MEKNADLPELANWQAAVVDVYHRAKESLKVDYTDLERSRLKAGFPVGVIGAVQTIHRGEDRAERVPSERMEEFIGELFTFLSGPAVPSENNAARASRKTGCRGAQDKWRQPVPARVEDRQRVAHAIRDLGPAGTQHRRRLRSDDNASRQQTSRYCAIALRSRRTELSPKRR